MSFRDTVIESITDAQHQGFHMEQIGPILEAHQQELIAYLEAGQKAFSNTPTYWSVDDRFDALQKWFDEAIRKAKGQDK